MKVEIGQTWKHRPSGDVRTVLDIVPYYVAAGLRSELEVDPDRRLLKVARLARVREPDGWVARDRRDSSDMEVCPDGRPRFESDWELLPSSEQKDVKR